MKHEHNGVTIYRGDAREVLCSLPDESVHCVVTSPPYWGLRDYGTAKWEGGDPEHKHQGDQRWYTESTAAVSSAGAFSEPGEANADRLKKGRWREAGMCKCGATRIDQQLGLERTPEEYVSKMVGVFAEVRRVLRDDGTLWLNMGDSYQGGNRGTYGDTRCGESRVQSSNLGSDTIAAPNRFPIPGLKTKDLVGVPWMLAFALRAPYEKVVIRDRVDRAWLAALVDGEGCLTILEAKSPHGSGDSYPPILQVRMCDTQCLERCVALTGYGQVSPEQKPPSQPDQRGSFQWRLSARKAADITAEIYPYLLIKRKQAIVLWNAQMAREGYEVKKGQRIPRESVERQRFCRELIQRLNDRQSVDIPSWMREPEIVVESGWYLRSDCIWAKPNPMPESVTDRPTKAHEYLFLLSKSERYYYDAEAIKEESVYGYGEGGHQRFGNPGGKAEKEYGSLVSGETWDSTGTRNKRSVWTVATQPFPEAHFATFPEELIQPCILAGCPAGGTVLDPFMGSGTTALVARRNHCKAIGIELNPEYIAIAEKRLGQAVFEFANQVSGETP